MIRDIPRKVLLFLITLCLLTSSVSADPALLSFSSRLTTVYAGREYDLLSMLESPEPDEEYIFTSSDTGIAIVEGNILTVLGEGYSRITVSDPSGNTAQMYIRASSPRPARHALIVSEKNYDDGRVRVGAENTAYGLADALANLSFRQGTPFDTTVLIDAAGDDLASRINTAFGSSSDDDVNLFYISCHGEIRDGEAVLVLHDGTCITVTLLERMLRGIRGRFLVMLDSCYSGSFIGKAAGYEYARSAANAFIASPLVSGRYLVLCSCGFEQESYRMSNSSAVAEENMSTIFARSFCEGLGWDLIRDARVSLRADTDEDGIVTFTEIQVYTRRRVGFHLAGTGAEQTVVCLPEINEYPFFARQSG